MEVAIPLSPMARAANTPAVLFLLMALAVPMPWLAKPKAKPLALIFLILKMFNKKVPSEAPIMPVIIVIIAVRDGIPPISSEIPIAMGAVTFLGIIVKIISSLNPKNFPK